MFSLDLSIHQIILSHFEEQIDSEHEGKELKDDEIFMGLINKIKIQKFYT